MDTSTIQYKLLDDRKYWQGVADHLVEQAAMDSQANYTFHMAQQKLVAIDRALRRVAAGTIERCDECGARIEPERLAILIDSGRHVCAHCAKASQARKPVQPLRRNSHSIDQQAVFVM